MNNKQKIEALAGMLSIEGMSAAEVAGLIQIPAERTLGDFTLPCFKLSKLLRKPPAAIADALAAEVNAKGGVRAESVNGYLNFFFDKQQTARTVLACLQNGVQVEACGAGKTVCIDYSSVNIAKPFHIGHLSTTVIGGALYRIFKRLGYTAVGINHLGDWGTQFGKLIAAFKKWGSTERLAKDGMKHLTELYVKFHAEAEKDATLDGEGRYYFKKIEDGDKEALELFSLFKSATLKEVEKTYKRLKIEFDSYNGESFFNDKMQPVLDELEKKGLLKESDGARVVELDGMPPCLLVKADGATLYATRDLAAAFFRKKTYNFDKCLYVVAYQQNLHFKQWFKVVELMGYEWAKDLIHVQFGMVSLESGTMSTRKGKITLLEDVLDKATARAAEIIAEKNPALPNKEAVAEQIGVGAVVFSALSNGRIKDIVFSYDKVLNFDGETAPYIQYTNARCGSILRKAASEGHAASGEATDVSGVDNPEGAELIALFARYSDVLCESAEKYEPSILSRYIVDVAQAFNKFYLAHRILNCADAERPARLALVRATKNIIEDGLALLGIACPEVM